MDAAKKALLKSRMKEAAQKRDKRIESPLVRYNELDQPVCKVCNVAVKSESLWPAHLVSRQHKEAADKLKAQAKAITATPSTNNLSNVDGSKTGTRVSSSLPDDFWDKPESKRAAQSGISKTDEIHDVPAQKQVTEEKVENIPSEPVKTVATPAMQVDPVTGKGATNSLPEGFFDNVDADYRARGLEPPKYDIQDEWKEFQKAIRDDIQEVDLRLEEEEFDAAEDRENLENLEQRELLERVEKFRKRELREKAEETEISEVIAKVVSKKPFSNIDLVVDDDSASDDDPEEEDALLDWRAKQF